MKVTIVGVGMGNPALLTAQAREAIEGAKHLVGARRLLDAFPRSGAQKTAANTPTELAAAIRAGGAGTVALVSGDVGFYSAARGLDRLLEGIETEYLPGISSLQYLCARLHTAWDDASILSLHGRAGDLPAVVARHPKVFVLTGGEPAGELCARLEKAGLGEVRVAVGERLSYPDERITAGTAAELAGRAFGALCVLLVEHPGARPAPVTHGLSDEAFLRGDAPMTKEEVRTVSVAKLRLRADMTVWDVGAGTGSVGIEIARVLAVGRVYAIERDAAALELLRQNRVRFGLANLEIVPGSAPEVLVDLPAPEAVFIGGSSGKLEEIIAAAVEKNPVVRLVINAITLETLTAALDCLNRFSLREPEVVQLTAARAREVGGLHMMMGQNPVWIVSAGGET